MLFLKNIDVLVATSSSKLRNLETLSTHTVSFEIFDVQHVMIFYTTKKAYN